MAHMLVLDIMGIYYISDLSLTLSGIGGSLSIFTGISTTESLLLLSSGVMSEIMIGSILIVTAWKLAKMKRFQLSSILCFVSIGFFADPIAYMFVTEGDLVTIFHMFGMSNLSFLLPVVGVTMSLVLGLVFYRYMKMVFCFSE